jgi:hypothetical protein
LKKWRWLAPSADGTHIGHASINWSNGLVDKITQHLLQQDNYSGGKHE